MSQLIICNDKNNEIRDIESIDALADAIIQFDGGVVIVSHDARLINVTQCRVVLIGDMKAELYNGTFEMYRKELIKKMEFVLFNLRQG